MSDEEVWYWYQTSWYQNVTFLIVQSFIFLSLPGNNFNQLIWWSWQKNICDNATNAISNFILVQQQKKSKSIKIKLEALSSQHARTGGPIPQILFLLCLLFSEKSSHGKKFRKLLGNSENLKKINYCPAHSPIRYLSIYLIHPYKSKWRIGENGNFFSNFR